MLIFRQEVSLFPKLNPMRSMHIPKNSDRSSLQILNSSREPSPSLRLDPPYRWVEPAKPELEQSFQVSSLSRAQAEPQA